MYDPIAAIRYASNAPTNPPQDDEAAMRMFIGLPSPDAPGGKPWGRWPPMARLRQIAILLCAWCDDDGVFRSSLIHIDNRSGLHDLERTMLCMEALKVLRWVDHNADLEHPPHVRKESWTIRMP